MDKRAKQTRRQLQTAFVELIQEKGFEGVSVKEIVTRAGVGRRTFYHHYQDKTQLLEEQIDILHEELKQISLFPPELNMLTVGDVGVQVANNFFVFVAKRRRLFKALLAGNSNGITRTRMHRTAVGVTLLFLENAGILTDSGIPADLVANMLAEMQIGLVSWWVKNDSAYPPELLAEIFVRIGERGVLGLVNWPLSDFELSARPFDITQYTIGPDTR